MNYRYEIGDLKRIKFIKNTKSYFPANLKSWNDVFTFIADINNSNAKRAGDLFEIFARHFFLAVDKYSNDYKHIWLGRNAPLDIKRRLGLEDKDVGYDLVAVTRDNKYAIIQCKFTSDQQNKTLGWTSSNLSSFLAASSKADIRIVFTNASCVDEKVRKKASEKSQYYEFSLSHLLRLTSNEINSIIKSIDSKIIPKKIRYKPREHQATAIKKVVSSFKKSDRGKLILPCGAGKTLTALWIKEKLKPRRTLILVPSLALLRQVKEDWKSQEINSSKYLCVCSEKNIDKNSDEIESNIFEIAGPVTTDYKKIRQFLESDEDIVVYATYQSSTEIQKAISGTKLKFDLAICDEAHKTAGNKKSVFSTILDDRKIPCSKRLFMTATPRVVGDLINKKDFDVEKLLADMNNSQLYGDEFFRLSFSDAISLKPQILTDYKIVAVGVSDQELQKAIEARSFINDDSTIDEIANNLALEKVMKKYQATHAITFHSSIKKATQFSERHAVLNNKGFIGHVSGLQSTSLRESILNNFKSSSSGVLSNSRCLTEGIDVPAIDMVYFCDPKNSKIDIVQAAGRALRVSKNKKFGYIVVPVFHKEKLSVEEKIENGCFKQIVSVVRALSDQDERIEEEIKKIVLNKGVVKNSSDSANIDLSEFELLAIEGFEDKLKNSVFSHIIRKTIPNLNWRPFAEARSFVHKLGLRNNKQWRAYLISGNKPNDIPTSPDRIYKNSGWKSWGDWLGTGLIYKGYIEYLSFDIAREYVRKLKLRNEHDWRHYTKSVRKPDNIPSGPHIVYKKQGWKGYGDWLGTGNLRNIDKEFLDFKTAREFVHRLKLQNQVEWRAYLKSGNKPNNIPSDPGNFYQDSGWAGMGDWLGTGNFKTVDMIFLDFKDARTFVHNLKLESQKEWREYTTSGKKPAHIPSDPAKVYAKCGWKGFGDWIGTGKIAPQFMIFRDFKDARLFVHALNIKNSKEWRKYCKSNLKPNDIPSNPEVVYSKEWLGYGDWLGNGNIDSRKKTFLKFEDARAFALSLGLRGQTDWRKYCLSGKKPHNIPSNPDKIYKKSGWLGYKHWLGIRD